MMALINWLDVTRQDVANLVLDLRFCDTAQRVEALDFLQLLCADLADQLADELDATYCFVHCDDGDAVDVAEIPY